MWGDWEREWRTLGGVLHLLHGVLYGFGTWRCDGNWVVDEFLVAYLLSLWKWCWIFVVARLNEQIKEARELL